MFVSGSFTLATALTPDTPFSSISPTTWTFADGLTSYEPATSAPASFFSVGTDGRGAIDIWQISLFDKIIHGLGEEQRRLGSLTVPSLSLAANNDIA